MPLGTSFYKSHAGHRPCRSEEAPLSAWLRNGRRCRPIYIDRAARRVSVYCAWPALILPTELPSYFPPEQRRAICLSLPPSKRCAGYPQAGKTITDRGSPLKLGECAYTRCHVMAQGLGHVHWPREVHERASLGIVIADKKNESR